MFDIEVVVILFYNSFNYFFEKLYIYIVEKTDDAMAVPFLESLLVH